MKPDNRDIEGYYLAPTAGLDLSKDRHFRFVRRVFADTFRYDSIESLCSAVASAK
jgi:hypothetical protein